MVAAGIDNGPMRVYPLASGTPAVRVVEPPQANIAQDAIQAARARILATPGAFDGPKLLTLAAGPDEIAVYETTYSVRLAHRNLAVDGVSPLGLGSLACSAAVFSPSAELLLARRSQHVSVSPGLWALPVSGGVDPGEHPDEAVRREAREELGLPDDVELRGVALCVGAEPVGCTLLYAATVPKADVVTAPSAEAEEHRWVSGRTLPSPAVAHLADLVAAARAGMRMHAGPAI